MSWVVPRRWVVNASPLIILGKINQLPLLSKLTESLVVPDGVAYEIEVDPESDPACQWLAGLGKDHVREIGELGPLIARWDLGRGEKSRADLGATPPRMRSCNRRSGRTKVCCGSLHPRLRHTRRHSACKDGRSFAHRGSCPRSDPTGRHAPRSRGVASTSAPRRRELGARPPLHGTWRCVPLARLERRRHVAITTPDPGGLGRQRGDPFRPAEAGDVHSLGVRLRAGALPF